MNDNTILGGTGNSWNYGAIVNGRVLFAEELELEALEEASEQLAEAAGGPFVMMIPVNHAGDADELEIVAGVPVAVAVVNDDSPDSVSVDVTADGAKDALARTLPESFWELVAELTGVEVVEDSEGLYVAAGGWSSVTYSSGGDTMKVFSENEPPHEALDTLEDGRLSVTYA